jgi:selenide,water dikinase
MREIVFDPQTSGGLLIAAAAEEAQALCDEIRRNAGAAAIIGEVVPQEDYAVVLV